MIASYPIHRSLIFWGGLLVIAFTGWAWMDSRGDDSFVRWRGISVGNVQNGIAVLTSVPGVSNDLEWRRVKSSKVFPGELAPPPFFLRGTSDEGVSFPGDVEMKPGTLKEYIRGFMRRRPPEAWCLFLPHWLIMVATAGVTVGLLVWRAGRWSKAQEPLVTAEAERTTMDVVR